MIKFPYRLNPIVQALHRRNKPCKIVATDGEDSVMVEFEDGCLAVVPLMRIRMPYMKEIKRWQKENESY